MTVSFSGALAWWFRLGCISFGGPAGQAVTAPLAAITAAVVGVVLQLGVLLARHALVDPIAIAICVAAGVALVRYDVGVVRVLAACAGVGVLRALI